MKVTNKWDVQNQFEIVDGEKRIFQSYNSIIAVIEKGKVTLGSDWDYSRTIGKYRNLFLGEDQKTTEAKIKSGEYIIDSSL